MQSQTVNLTVWEAKERAGLLALETEEWRGKRLIAEDPNTTGDVLAPFTDDLLAFWTKDVVATKWQGHLLAEAICAHHNTSPQTLLKLLNLQSELWAMNGHGWGGGLEWTLSMDGLAILASSHCARGICRNPVTPFLCLETPDFWEQVGDRECAYLLSQESLSQQVVAQIGFQKYGEYAPEYAQFHFALAGEVPSRNEGIKALTRYQRSLRKREDQGSVIFDLAEGSEKKDLEFLQDICLLPFWTGRLNAALKIPLTHADFSSDLVEGWNRTLLDLMHHLSQDGNRFVRWAAQTRLANPDFVFTWADEE